MCFAVYGGAQVHLGERLSWRLMMERWVLWTCSPVQDPLRQEVLWEGEEVHPHGSPEFVQGALLQEVAHRESELDA